MSYCIWMGWFSAFNQTLAQLLNVIVALINRDHGVISVSRWAPACYHAVHSHSLPTMDFNGFLALYSGEKSTPINFKTVSTWTFAADMQTSPNLHQELCLKHSGSAHSLRSALLSLNFQISIFTIVWRIVRTFLNVYFFPTTQNYFRPGDFPGSYRAHLAVFGFFLLLLSSPRLPIPTFRFPQLAAAIN